MIAALLKRDLAQFFPFTGSGAERLGLPEAPPADRDHPGHHSLQDSTSDTGIQPLAPFPDPE